MFDNDLQIPNGNGAADLASDDANRGVWRERGWDVTLMDLREGDEAILERIDLPEDDGRRLMELGFLPGMPIVAARSSPFGDPRVFRVDGSEVAIRRETAMHVFLRRGTPAATLDR